MDDEREYQASRYVVGAVAAGLAPLPFLAVYALLFIIHGSVHKISPPDITGSSGGELVAGLIALALFLVLVVALHRLLTRGARALFLLCQLAALGASVYFVVDRSSGPLAVPVVLVITSALAIGLLVADVLPSRRTAIT